MSEEQVKDLPFTVNVINDVELEQRRLTNMEDVMRGTPGVDVNSWGGASEANVRIRGVGSLYQTGDDDSSVVLNVDGVHSSVGNIGLGTLDAEQIEIIKGPQGTLFGHNSAAGAINVRTRQPTLGKWEGNLRGELGSNHQHLAEGAINLPLGQTVAARFALRHSAQDYWYDNLLTGKPISRPSDLAWRASLLWQPQQATSVLLRASRHNARKYQNAMLLYPYGKHPGQVLSTLADEINDNRRSIEQQALQVQHDFARARLTSVTSHEKTASHQTNLTGTEVTLPWLGQNTVQPQIRDFFNKNWNQELRLSSLPGSQTFWVAGFNAYGSDWGDDKNGRKNTSFHQLSHNSHALFGEATWPLGSSGLKLTTGLRYTRERKGYDSTYSSQNGAVIPDARTLHENHLTGRVGLNWELSPQTNVHATLARGRKSGGFNRDATQLSDSIPYLPGEVDSLEIGARHTSADGRLSLDGALFFNRVKHDHLIAFDPTTFASWMVNVNTRSKGLELNANWRAGGGFTLTGGLAWIDGSIRSHAVTNTPAGDVNVGNRLPDVPRISAMLALQYQRTLPAFWGLQSPTLNARLSVRHVGKRASDPQNSFDLKAYQKVDLRVGVASGNTELYLWADNLLNKQYDLYGYYFNNTLSVGMPARGRSVGLGLVHFF